MPLDNQDFKNWKEGQDLDHWHSKYSNKCHNAGLENIKCLLTFEEYIYKAFEAGLNSPDEIGQSSESYVLGRINDEGDYTVESCRFITRKQNIAENKNLPNWYGYKRTENHIKRLSESHKGHTNSQGEKHGNAKLTNKQVIEIFLSEESYDIICSRYNCTNYTIHRIKTKERWKSVTKDLEIKNDA